MIRVVSKGLNHEMGFSYRDTRLLSRDAARIFLSENSYRENHCCDKFEINYY